MSTASPDVRVFDDDEGSRYVIEVDGKQAGFADYRIRRGRHLFVHTEIDASFEGRGFGSTLARGALDDVAAKNGSVVPICPFIRAWIERHPDYQHLVDHNGTGDGSPE